MASLGDRHKQYEAQAETHIDLTRAVVIRLDGKCFHTFTKGFLRPFDERLHQAFVLTCRDLMDQHSGCSYAYTQSDEITMIFPVKQTKTGEFKVNLDFSGRVQKLVSTVAALATLKFNSHLRRELDRDPELQQRKQDQAIFDARIFNMNPVFLHHEPSPDEAYGNVELANSLLWRYRDCIKNSKAAFAQSLLGHKTVTGLNGDEMIAKVELETGVRWEDLTDWKKYGTLLQREVAEVPELTESKEAPQSKPNPRRSILTKEGPFHLFHWA